MTSTASTPLRRRPVVLIVDNHEWSSRSLMSVLSAEGWRVILTHTVQQALDAASAQAPDLVFINQTLPNGDGIDLCQTLRQDPRIGVGLPILVTAPDPPTRVQRLAALRAGAWEFVSYPIDAEDLRLRLDSYLAARFELTRLLEQSLIDEITGLYNMRGLERRTREIASIAIRSGQSVACVVLSPTIGGRETEPTSDIQAAAARWGNVLATAGRKSDTIGRLGQAEFAVVALDTDVAGAIQLAERLGGAFRSTLSEEEASSFDIRAGFEAISDLSDRAGEPTDLLVHATRALQKSKRFANGDWIQPFSQE